MSAIVEKFLRWARRAPVEARCEAAQALARSYLHSPVSPEERDELEAAMTVLLDDRAMDVRMALAREIAASDKAPHHVILSLAGDRDPVAAIVAEQSPLILDSELVDMVATRGIAVQAAIASRPFLSRAVSAAVGEVAALEACQALIRNRGARIPRFSLDRIVVRHGDSPEMRLTLLEREDLPIDVREVLLGKLASALRELIVSHEWLAPGHADLVIRDAHECATIANAFEEPADNMPALVAQLMAGQALTPTFLIRTVAAGQTRLFEAALSTLAGMPLERVGALVASGRASTLRALLQKAGLPRDSFAAFIAAIEVIRRGMPEGDGSDYRRATQLIDAIVERYQKNRPNRELDQILMLLRRFAREAKRAAARGYAEEMMEAA
jgi:uncharacterized protein (DUF2336 family)